jgi:hypothetical protein
MNINNFSLATLAYAESHLLPQINGSFGKWMTYAGLLVKMPEIEKKLVPALKEFGAISDTGEVDFNKIRTVGLAAFEKVPTVEFADFSFDRNDFESFISFLSTQA